MKRNLHPLILYLTLCLLITSCQCTFEQSENIYMATHGSDNLHKIAAAEYGTAVFPETDTVQLTFPCISENPVLSPGLSSRRAGRSVWIWHDGVRQSNGNGNGIGNSLRSAPPSTLQANFPFQNYSLKIASPVQVLAGDANNDGKINMMDLYPIALGIRKFQGVPIVSTVPNSPAPPIPGGMTFNRMPSGQTWTWKNLNHTVDFIHADCNGDGIIDQADVSLVKGNLNPLLVPNMLQSQYTNIGLRADLSTNHPIEMYTRQMGVNPPRSETRVWYDIQIAEPVNQSGDSIFGVVFTRPVAEAPERYEVLNIQIDTEFSDMVHDTSDLLGLQRYWDLPIKIPESCQGPEAVSKLLDVGVFNIRDIKRMGKGDCIISCGVTIDDMLRTAGTGQANIIYQHLINVVIFIKRADGSITVKTTDCSFDAVDLSQVTNIVTYNKPENLPRNWYGG